MNALFPQEAGKPSCETCEHWDIENYDGLMAACDMPMPLDGSDNGYRCYDDYCHNYEKRKGQE